MTPLEVLKSVIKDKLKCEFVYADLYAANLGVDKIEKKGIPIFIYVAPVRDKNSLSIAGAIKKKIPIFGFFMFHHEQATDEFTYESVEPLVQRGKDLVDALVHELNANPLTDPETQGIENWESLATYAKFDANLFGATCDIPEWPVDTQTTGCL